MEGISESLEGFVKTQIAGPTLRVSPSVVWGDAHAAGAWMHLENG